MGRLRDDASLDRLPEGEALALLDALTRDLPVSARGDLRRAYLLAGLPVSTVLAAAEGLRLGAALRQRQDSDCLILD